jgi:DNA (cytosine-5)-methyltransferase 1
VANPSGPRLPPPEREGIRGAWGRRQGGATAERGWWSVEPGVGRVAYGVAARVDRLKCLGNGQVPECMATAWRILTEQA